MGPETPALDPPKLGGCGCFELTAESNSEVDPKSAGRTLSRSLRVARWAVRFARFLRIEYPIALREFSLTLAAKGKTKKALKYARKSCAIAEQQQARYERAKSMRVCGQLSLQLNLPDARQQIEEADVWLAEFEKQIESVSNQLSPVVASRMS